jgi:hypothetical protein
VPEGADKMQQNEKETMPMNPEDLRQLLIEIRDTNRQLGTAQQQIAQSFSHMEEMGTTQLRSWGWTKYSWVMILLPLLVIAPIIWNLWYK